MKKILILIIFISSLFAQIRIEQLPDANLTLSQALQKLSLFIINQDETGLGGSNYKTRKITFDDFLTALAIADTNIVLQNKINNFFKDNTFYQNWYFGGDSASIGTKTFLSGLNGTGTKYSKLPFSNPTDSTKKSTQGYTLELDNLIVRENLFAGNYISNNTIIGGGDYHFTQGAVVDSVYYVEEIGITYADGSPIVLENGDSLTQFPYQAVLTFQDNSKFGIAPYIVGDLIECKVSKPRRSESNTEGALLRTIRGIVRKVVGVKVYIDLDASSIENEVNLRALIEPGYTFARVGHLTDASRDGSVYVDVSTPNSPKITVYDQVNSFLDWDGFEKNRVIMGNLDGIEDPRFSVNPSGYGLYGENVYLTGELVITGGSTYDDIESKLATSSVPQSIINKDSVIQALEGETFISGGFVATRFLLADNIAVGTLRSSVLTADSITTGTLTGVTVQSSDGASRIVLSSGNSIDFYVGNSLNASLSSGSIGTQGLATFGGALVRAGIYWANNVYIDTGAFDEVPYFSAVGFIGGTPVPSTARLIGSGVSLTQLQKLQNSVSGTFTTTDGKTITVSGGMITAIN